VCNNFLKRDGSDKAQVERARHRQMRFGFVLGASYVHVDFLIPEFEGDATFTECL
jgi:hypothetical protein